MPAATSRFRCLRTRDSGRSSAFASAAAASLERARWPAIERRSGSARARRMSSGVSAMSVATPTIRRMQTTDELTPAQRRTLEGLIGTDERPVFAVDGVDERLDEGEPARRRLAAAGVHRPAQQGLALHASSVTRCDVHEPGE